MRKYRLIVSLLMLITCLFFLGLNVYGLFFQVHVLAKKDMQLAAEELAEMLKVEIESDLAIARTLSHTLAAVKHNKAGLTRDGVQAILKSVLNANPSLLGVYTAWEKDGFDKKDKMYAGKQGCHPKGVFVPYCTRDERGELVITPLTFYDTPGKGDYYLIPKKNLKELVTEPQKYTIYGRQLLLVSLVAPVIVDTTFRGVVGVDVSIDDLQAMLYFSEFNAPGNKIHMVSNTQIHIASTDTTIKPGQKVEHITISKSDVITSLKFEEHETYFHATFPVYFGNCSKPWYIIIEKKKADYIITLLKDQFFWEFAGFSILSFLSIVLVFVTLKKKKKK